MVIKKVNEKTETLMAFQNALLIVNYYWELNGDYILWNSKIDRKTVWTDADVEVTKVSFTQMVSGATFDHEATKLKVNGITLGGSVLDTEVELMNDGTVLVVCKLVVGWN